jgi:hypothetical protein
MRFATRRLGGALARVEKARADDDGTGIPRRRIHEPPKVGRVVLAVAIERGDIVRSLGHRDVEPGPQRGGLAEIGLVAHDPCRKTRQRLRRAVCRSVVDHDDDRRLAQRTDDDAPDRASLVERGYDDRKPHQYNPPSTCITWPVI